MSVTDPASGDAQVAAAARRLQELLCDHVQYRSRWERYALQHRGAAVHQGAVAMVLAAHLWDTGQSPETDQALPRRLKDVVSRALGGRVLSARTLLLFADAFAMTPDHAAELQSLRSGRSIGGADSAEGPEPARDRQRPGIAGQHFQTVALHELHTLGLDGVPIQHRTMHLIRAIQDVDRYRYMFDTDAVRVQVLRGGTAGSLYSIDGLFAVDIEFDRPLRPGETGSFEYVTRFDYRSPPEPVFRRGARERVENVELHVRFHPLRLPDEIWWAVWPDYLGSEASEEVLVELEPEGSVHRFLPVIEHGAVGFRWHFPPHA